MKFRVALLQIASLGNDSRKNLAKGLESCREAKALGADLAVFPELWSTGPCPANSAEQKKWVASAIDRSNSFFHDLSACARELAMNIAVTYLETAHPKPLNSAAVIRHDGKVVLNYSKVCICDFEADGGNEAGCDVNCGAGESFDVCSLAGAEGEVKVGVMICADREFPEPATQLMLNGAELVVIPNACTWDGVRSAGLLTRATENMMGVAMANYPQPLNNGGSRAYKPATDGCAQDLLVANAGEDEEVLIAEFDVTSIRELRRMESWRTNHRRRALLRGKSS